MKSYGSKLPLQPLAPASFFLRGAGFLVATAFVVSMVFMVAVMQSVGARGNVRVSIAFNQDHPVTHGQFVPMNEAKNAPSVSIEGGVTGSADRYTYVLIDIDAPDPKAPTHAPFLHYIVAGLAANGQSTSQQDTVEVVSYYPVTPPIGEHRYVSLLFRQQESDPSAPDADLTAKRANFDVDEFTKKHKLDLVDKSYFHSRPAAQDN
ncbi:uncharacterized protein PITG_08718 [Phytophthora infestans T30-4]|uniref:Phosphatidylethanolamine-binding protein n=1 Tax=Phytophthora infestans (strain T30-4) TaxID=403677 RepID=D0ND14_PHYIT|nr:uncharacterized protein PITG_08718 [Phytophthora infestans T30-4]EEY55971.1 conserved hypothetical protein [Phytophthora infestans T30-4]|eukprot:XP_002902801.1 conserved hypothetical protein [Phytophthora infestans T30-4]